MCKQKTKGEMFKMKVLLAPTLEIASKVKADATVEAEYGSQVVKGTKITLAHHVPEYKNCPAPCIAIVEPLQEPTILVSHVDLDTIGGIMSIIGEKPEHPAFWEAVAFIDLNGRHRLAEVSKKVQPLIKGAWAIDSKYRLGRVEKLTNITKTVQKYIDDIQSLLAGNKKLIRIGEREFEKLQQSQENCLIEEDRKVRFFITENVPCSFAYYSPSLKKVVPLIVVFNNKFKSITVSCENGQLNVGKFVKELWGEGAGGHAGIGGSPRGKEMTLADAKEAVKILQSRL
jgi:hypothetical protein